MGLSSKQFQYLSNLVKQHSGIFITEDKSYLMESRLSPLVTKYGLQDLNELTEYYEVNKSNALREEIVEAMTTNESLFFRDNKPFERLKDTIIPRIIGKCPNKRHIRIWSAACSTGQEPYSIAMAIMEEPMLSSLTFEILATDIDNSVLDKARLGMYNQFEVQRGVPINYLLKYFTQENEDWRVKDVLKQRIRFDKFNLLDKPDFDSKFDIIFCRNVLIYFEPETKTQIILNMQYSLESYGALVLGSSENIFGVDGCNLSALRSNSESSAPGVFVFNVNK
jgi:chemotaxis protein methyltransferase CheR